MTQIQTARLATMSERLSGLEDRMFGTAVRAIEMQDTTRATMYANEAAEIRRVKRVVLQVKLALEQIILRLDTVKELGDVVSNIAPATSLMNSLKPKVSGILPEAEKEMEGISEMLSAILVDAGQAGGYILNFQVANAEAERILDEASKVAEQQTKRRFPDINEYVAVAS